MYFSHCKITESLNFLNKFSLYIHVYTVIFPCTYTMFLIHIFSLSICVYTVFRVEDDRLWSIPHQLYTEWTIPVVWRGQRSCCCHWLDDETTALWNQCHGNCSRCQVLIKWFDFPKHFKRHYIMFCKHSKMSIGLCYIPWNNLSIELSAHRHECGGCIWSPTVIAPVL